MATEAAATPDANTVVTYEHDGRKLSGMGASVDTLKEVMETPSAQNETAMPLEAPAEPPSRPTRGQARFAELTKARKDAEERAAAFEKELTELKARGAAPQAATVPAVPSSPPPAPASPSVPNGADSGASSQPQATRPKPTEDEVGSKYKTYADFIDDLADWKLEQHSRTVLQSDLDSRIRAGIDADRTQRDFLSHAESTWAKGRKVYADFDAVRTSGPGAQVPMASDKINAIIYHPQSEHLQHAIGKDAALAQRLAQAHPIEFGLILSTLAPAAGAGSLASTPTAASVTPPAPVQPVGSGSPTTTPSLADAATMSMDAYREMRNRMKQRGRR